jgi:hypothetical protein
MQKEIVGFPDYFISEDGIIIKKSGRKIKTCLFGRYIGCTLYKNGKRNPVHLHRLLAKTETGLIINYRT